MTAEDFDVFMASHVVDIDLLRTEPLRWLLRRKGEGRYALIPNPMGKPVTNLDGDGVVVGFGAVLGRR